MPAIDNVDVNSRTYPIGGFELFLLALLFIDVGFVVLDQVRARSDLLSSQMFSISLDHGYAEIYGYGKELAMAVMCLVYARISPQGAYAAWALVFGFFFLDDAFRIHERAGDVTAHWLQLGPAFGGLADDLGELAVAAATGVVLLTAVALGYRFSGSTGRLLTLILLNLTAALVFFGVGLDIIHALASGTVLSGFFRLAEDGGEMLVMSVMTYYLVRVDARGGRFAPSHGFRFMDAALLRMADFELALVRRLR